MQAIAPEEASPLTGAVFHAKFASLPRLTCLGLQGKA
jgi:hypothetical protein